MINGDYKDIDISPITSNINQQKIEKGYGEHAHHSLLDHFLS